MRKILTVLVSVALLGGIAYWWTQPGSGRSEQPPASVLDSEKSRETLAVLAPRESPDVSPRQQGPLYDPVVVAPCNLVPVQEQDVSSQVDGVFQEIHVELGQAIRRGDILGRLDDRQLRPQVELLHIKAKSEAAERIARAQHDEADSKVAYALKANESGLRSVPELEYKTYLLQRERFAQEIKKAREDREAALKELEKAKVLLEMHRLRSGLSGEVVKVYKRNGEAVKQAEPLFRVANNDRLRIEGLCKVQQADVIRLGMRALVEPELRGEQMTVLRGHTAAVTGLAVSRDGRLVASASEDKSVILWNWPQGSQRALLSHPAEVYALAFTSGAEYRGKKGQCLLLTGCADGQARLWLISGDKMTGPFPLSAGHEGTIRAVAFSADGKWCATGGEDKRIGIWETAGGKHLYWLRPGEDLLSAHQGAVTCIHFTPDGQLISAGRDNALKIWQLDATAGTLVAVHKGRTGEVSQLGISPDGRRLLFDHGEELRILDRDQGTGLGSLRGRRQGRLQAFALLSPSGKLALAAANNGRLQLWNVPATPAETSLFRLGYRNGFHRGTLVSLGAVAVMPDQPAAVSGAFLASAGGLDASGLFLPRLWNLPGHEIRHFLVPNASVVMCGAFAPDEAVFFTGGNDKVVRVWAIPAGSPWSQPFEARVTYIGSQVERGTDMIRIRAEMDNPSDSARRLRPGTFAALTLFPETAHLK